MTQRSRRAHLCLFAVAFAPPSPEIKCLTRPTSAKRKKKTPAASDLYQARSITSGVFSLECLARAVFFLQLFISVTLHQACNSSPSQTETTTETFPCKSYSACWVTTSNSGVGVAPHAQITQSQNCSHHSVVILDPSLKSFSPVVPNLGVRTSRRFLGHVLPWPHVLLR